MFRDPPAKRRLFERTCHKICKYNPQKKVVCSNGGKRERFHKHNIEANNDRH